MLNALSRFRSGERRVDARTAIRVATAVFALLLAAQALRLLLVFVEPKGPELAGLTLPVPSLKTRIAGFDPFFRNGVADSPSTAGGAEGPGLVLFGVRSGGGRGAAILAGSDGVQRSYRVGDEVAPGVTLKSVGFDHVVLVRGGVTRRLEFPRSAQTLTPPAAQPARADPAVPATPPSAPAAAAPAEPST